MLYARKEIEKRIQSASYIEVYQFKDNTRRLHTDFVKYIGGGTFDNKELDHLPYNDKGECDVDIEIMTLEEYDKSINANSCERASEWMKQGETIAVVVVRDYTLDL